MNEVLKDKLRVLASDEITMRAIAEVFNQVSKKPKVNEVNDNQVLGEQYRAYVQAQEIIEKGFSLINSYKENPKNNNKFNKEV